MTNQYPTTWRNPQDGINQAIVPAANSAITIKHGFLPTHCDRVILNALTCPITDTGGTIGGHGSVILASFPQGSNRIIGANGRLVVTRVGTNITATATVKLGIGTAAISAADVNLTSTECNFAGAANTGTAMVGGVVTFNIVQDAFADHVGTTLGVNDVFFVGSLTAAGSVFLNFHVADAGITANDSVTVTGYVDLIYEQWGNRNLIGNDGNALP